MRTLGSSLHCLFLLITAFGLCAYCGAARAQTALLVPPLANPNLDIVRSGRVDALLRLSDGRTLVGGLFDRLGVIERAGTARLLADGSVDPSFATVATATGVVAFALDAQARVYLMTSTRVLRLFENGGTDTAFATIALSSGSFRKLQISGDQLIVGGTFSSINGSVRNNLAKFDLGGNLDASWQPNPDDHVLALHAPGNGFVYVGGNFANIGGTARSGIARVALSGSGAADAWAPTLAQALGTPAVTALESAAGSLYVAGEFTSVNGSARTRLAKLDLAGAGALDGAWLPACSRALSVLRVIGSSLYVAGAANSFSFNASSGAGTLNAVRMARFASAGGGALDVNFAPIVDPSVNDSIIHAIENGDGGGRLLVAGNFSRLTSASVRLGLAALNADGTLDTLSAVPEASLMGGIKTLESNVDGSVFVQGNFVKVNGAERRNLFKLSPNLVVDSQFRPADFSYDAAALQPGVGIFVADSTANRILKLDLITGEPIPGFSALAYTQGVNKLQLAGPHVYVFGSFLFSSITPSIIGFGRIATATGSFDGNFRPTIVGSVTSAHVDSATQSLFLFGFFSSVNSNTRTGMAKLNLSTSVIDSAWNPVLTDTGTPSVASTASDGAGGIFIAGAFSSINGAPCRGPARLLIAGNGVLDANFSCARSTRALKLIIADGAVYATQLLLLSRFALSAGGNADSNWSVPVDTSVDALSQVGNRLLIGGGFKIVSNQTRKTLAALPLIERYLANGFE